jgi:hypothetical protein
VDCPWPIQNSPAQRVQPVETRRQIEEKSVGILNWHRYHLSSQRNLRTLYCIARLFIQLEARRSTIESAVQTAPVWKMIRYLAWAYCFKLGIFFVGTGVLLRTSIPATRFWLVVSGGIAYLLLAYVPIPGPHSPFFGVGGGLITVSGFKQKPLPLLPAL